MDTKQHGGPAFPDPGRAQSGKVRETLTHTGMTLRDYFAAAALSNPALCTGVITSLQFEAWYGRNASDVTRKQIVAKQAYDTADALLAERKA